MAEEVGFEPTELALNGFQDRRLRPLGHSSTHSCKQEVVLVPFQKKAVNIMLLMVPDFSTMPLLCGDC